MIIKEINPEYSLEGLMLKLHPGLAALGAGLLASPRGLRWAGSAASPGTWGSLGATFPLAGAGWCARGRCL